MSQAVPLDRVLRGSAQSVLGKLSPGHADLVIWERDVAQSVCQRLDRLEPDQLPSFRIDGDLSELSDSLGGQTWPAKLDWLRTDVSHLAASFSAASGAESLSVKLHPVSSDSCRFLHHDYVPERLVCTYRGPGTEWVPPSLESSVADRKTDVDPSVLRHVPRFGVAIFTGRTSSAARPILHRSPPIAGRGIVRLVLTIDVLRSEMMQH